VNLPLSQLFTVEKSLADDPTNDELVNLKDELKNLIQLTEQLIGTTSSSATASPKPGPSKPKQKPAPSSSTPSTSTPPPKAFSTGDECQARWSADQKWYPAKVVMVGGSSDNPVYTVLFRGYDSTEYVTSGDIKPLTESKKRAIALSEEEIEREKKKKKNAKKEENRQQKAAEQSNKAQAWSSFAKKGAKKGSFLPPIQLRSSVYGLLITIECRS
jgi:survival-of-motor-neuron-related-splicing factor 30